MLSEILNISGKPGLYLLLTGGKGALIVESLDAEKKRLPIHRTDKVVSLGDISIFTDEEEMPLRRVFQLIEEKYGKDQVLTVDLKKASNQELLEFMAGVVADFDRERVYPSHVKKIISWYNILVQSKQNDFSEPEEPQEVEVESAE
ncbi:MAG: DUF5606 domain-containing protein [Bacteroidaceae bacterium]|jgi:hypothetical protein|nr:DUF5606 domain-containing protein [Bacteroidaceae bacterium]MBR4302380.1 DUF5606 domain-containing protein [Bacteroidaceae bacterium]